jgi:type I restriction enzyme S subunit
MSSFSASPSNWEIKDLRDVPIAIIDGDRGKNYPAKEEFSPEGFCLFLNTGNIQNDTFDFTNCDFITENKDALLRKGKLSRNDIVLTTRGTVGSIGYFHRGIQHDHIRINSGMVILRCGRSLSPSYFYQLFKSKTLKTQFELYSSGSAQPQLPIKDLRRVKLLIPKLATQQKIAAILSAYDERIENNKRRIALLENLAEEIYREWFVRLRFPGHENVKKIKGVPEGWEVKRISEIVNFLSGYSFKSETYTPSGRFGVVTIKNVQEGYFIPECTDFIDEPPANMKEHCVLNAGDVLMSLTGNVGRVCHVYGSDMLLNQRVAKLESRLKNASQFVYYTFNNRSMIQLIENLSLGSTAQMNLSAIQLGKQKLVVPDADLLFRFENAIQPLTSLKLNLYNQSEKLKGARDRLLPRLISGKLPVDNLNIQFPPGVAEELNTEPPATAHA